MKTDHARVDYLPCIARKIVGVIEAKPMGTLRKVVAAWEDIRSPIWVVR